MLLAFDVGNTNIVLGLFRDSDDHQLELGNGQQQKCR